MVSQEIKSVFGYFILLAAVIGFVIAFIATQYLVSVLFIIGGLLIWMIYLNIAEVKIFRPTGAILIIFGVLLSTAIFMAFGIEQDMWGGFRIKPDGATLSLIILFFAVMPGLVFYYFHKSAQPSQLPPQVPAPLTEVSREQAAPPEYLPNESYEHPEWTEEDFEYYDPEAWAAYYEWMEEEEENEED